ncbi:MAG: ligand-gated channel [Hyphomicrobiales bacterium]|nr:MAG: ligand-gated channel [Hyphomicrobiales bacterium]
MFKLCNVSVPMGARATFRALSIALLISISSIPTGAMAQSAAFGSELVKFSIPAGPLGQVIFRFGKLSNIQLLYAADLVRGKRATAISGSMTREQALTRLLGGTGLVYQFTAANTVTILNPAATDTSQVADDGSILLGTIIVSGAGASDGKGFQGTPDWVYKKPSSTSVVSREAIKNDPGRNTRDLLDTVAGVYANRSEAQNPGISVNVRGLQDQDRVATMIDGARQSFQRNGHGATQRTYVDSAFIREIDIEKSSTSGVGSAGTLGGSVNFRTLIADDLIEPGRNWGMELNSTTGTNAFNFNGSIAGAVRFSDTFSVLGGISHKRIGAFEIGKYGSVKQNTTYTGDIALFSGQVVESTILKTELAPTGDIDLTFGWVRNESDFSTGFYDQILGGGALKETGQVVVNDTYTAALDWNPDSDLIDFEARAYFNRTNNEETSPNSTIPGVPSVTGTSSYQMDTYGGSLQNTSQIDTSLGALTLNFGGEAFHDEGETKLNGGQYVVWDQAKNAYVDYSDVLSGGTPSGSRTVASGFINAKLEHEDWLTIEGGVRYDWHNISGDTVIFGGKITPIINTYVTPIVCAPSPPFPPNVGCKGGDTVKVYGDPYNERFNVNIDNSGDALLPTLMIAVQPTDWMQPFVKYSRSFRPPSVMESFINGGHAGSSINGYAPNPNLRPERAETYEYGVNISHDSLFLPDDAFRLKAVGFYREIEDYISFGTIRNDQANQVYTSYLNLNGITSMRGLEVEANYDAGSFYIGGALTFIETDFADSYTTPGGNDRSINAGQGAAIIFEQPEMRVTMDAGVRLFDKKLTLGMRMNDVGDSEPALGSLRRNNEIDGYRVFDLYGSYAFNDKTKLSFTVSNLEDLAYAPAVGATYYASPGRTFTVSLRSKF